MNYLTSFPHDLIEQKVFQINFIELEKGFMEKYSNMISTFISIRSLEMKGFQSSDAQVILKLFKNHSKSQFKECRITIITF